MRAPSVRALVEAAERLLAAERASSHHRASGTQAAAGTRRCRRRPTNDAIDEGDDRGPEREQLEAVEPQRQPDPVEALTPSCRLPGGRDDRGGGPGLRAAARWPRTTSSRVAGRPPTDASPRTRLRRSPAGPGKTPTSGRPAGCRRSPSAASITRCSAMAPGDRQVEQRLAGAEHEQPVAGLLDVGDDVRRQERRRAVGVDRVDQDVEEFATRQRVEAGQRLVEEEDRRPRPERERQSDLRLLAAGQLIGARRRAGCRGRRGGGGRSPDRTAAGASRPSARARRRSARGRATAPAARSRSARCAAPRSFHGSMPSTVRRPSVGRSKPTHALSRVDLPEPFGPTSAVMLPSGTWRSTWRSAQLRRP